MKLTLHSQKKVPLNIKKYFDELKNISSWIVRIDLNRGFLYTLSYRDKNGDSKFLKWNEKVIFFEKIEDLAYFLISNSTSSIVDGMFFENTTARGNFESNKVSKESGNLTFLCFSIAEVIALLNYKDWSKFDLKQLNFIVDNINMLTDFEEVKESDLMKFNDFMNYITFIVNSEIIGLNNFDKAMIRKSVKSLTKSFLENSLMIISVSAKNKQPTTASI